MNNDAFVAELSKLRSSSTFLSLKGYHNLHGEVADVSIVFHMSYENALKRSIQTLEELEFTTALEKQAQSELIASFNDSLERMEETPFEELQDGYQHFRDDDGEYIKGIKLHTRSQVLHLYGLVVHKKILVEGCYPQKNQRPLTVAKDKMRYLTAAGKFRQYRVLPTTVDRIAVEKMELLPRDF